MNNLQTQVTGYVDNWSWLETMEEYNWFFRGSSSEGDVNGDGCDDGVGGSDKSAAD